MRFSILARDIQYDTRGFITSTFKGLRQQMLEAAQDFLLVALPAIPIDTGMARGSYLNMLQLLDANGLTQADSLIPTTAQRRLKNGNYIRYIHSDGEDYQKQPKTAKKFTTTRGQIIKREGQQLKFNYEIDVVHYNIMDEFNPHGEDWHSIRKGREAFLKRMSTYKPEGVSKYLVLSSYTYGTRGDGTQKTLKNQKTVK